MKDLTVASITIFSTLIAALILILVTTYFSTFVTYADFNKYKIDDQKINTRVCTKLEIIIKNQDNIKKKLDIL